jgi:hypothetical protein
MTSEPDEADGETGLTAFSRDVVRAALVDVVSKALLLGTGSFAALIGLLIWQGGSIPAWLAAVLVAFAVAMVLVARRQTKRLKRRLAAKNARIAALEPVADRVPELEEDLGRYESGLERHEFYTEHIAQVLDHLQRVVSGDIGIPIPTYIERGILAPARDLLMKYPEQDVRLSVLLTSDGRWKMTFGAGHSVAGQTKYNALVADTLSRLALEDGETHRWPDVLKDQRFRANPKATRPIRAMISLPLRSRDTCVWRSEHRVVASRRVRPGRVQLRRAARRGRERRDERAHQGPRQEGRH